MGLSLIYDSRKKLMDFSKNKAREYVSEAIKWKSGPNIINKIKTKIYSFDGYDIVVFKPGKFVEKGKINDMEPCIFKGNKEISDGYTFEEFARLLIPFKDKELKILGALIYRLSFVLDHERNEQGKWRYCIPNIVEEIETKVDGYSVKVFLYFLDILSLNETCCYGLKRRGNCLGTICNYIATYIGNSNRENFSNTIPRGRYIPPTIKHENAKKYFPLLRSKGKEGNIGDWDV